MDSITPLVSQALHSIFSPILADIKALPGYEPGYEQALTTPHVMLATNTKFGHYQVNNTGSIAKILKELHFDEHKPAAACAQLSSSPADVSRVIAEAVLAADKKASAIISKVVPAGIFVNLFLQPSFLTKRCVDIYLRTDYRPAVIHRNKASYAGGVDGSDDFVPPLAQAPRMAHKKILVDFSAPNVAKSMHVGHLRSTIIGDSVCRMLEYLGHETLRISHIGDWGTQFGMLVTYLLETMPEFCRVDPDNVDRHGRVVDPSRDGNVSLPIADLVAFYKLAKQKFDSDPEFMKRSQVAVVRLQRGDRQELYLWRKLCDVSHLEFARIYDQLDVVLEEVGESFYNDLLPDTVADVMRAGVAREDDGAIIIKLDGMTCPMMVRKSDGGYGYDTTDLAAIRYRLHTLCCDRLIYITDAGQSTHFDNLFRAATALGWMAPGQAGHFPFGVVLGEDGKKLKTRSGETVRLEDLISEAVAQARQQVLDRERAAGLPADELEHIARAIGVGAIKYADLSSQRIKDYRFSFAKMLSFKGNTAAYLLYSYARISSICRKIGVARKSIYDETAVRFDAVSYDHPAEVALLVVLFRFHDILLAIYDDLMLHRLCEWVYQIATAYTDFYEKCRVLESSPEEVEGGVIRYNQSRLALCEMARQALRISLHLLGITEVERM